MRDLPERRKFGRVAHDPQYDGFTDRRQPRGVVATWCRVFGGELVRCRVNYLHLAAVMRAKHEAAVAGVGTMSWEKDVLMPKQRDSDKPKPKLRIVR